MPAYGLQAISGARVAVTHHDAVMDEPGGRAQGDCLLSLRGFGRTAKAQENLVLVVTVKGCNHLLMERRRLVGVAISKNYLVRGYRVPQEPRRHIQPLLLRHLIGVTRQDAYSAPGGRSQCLAISRSRPRVPRRRRSAWPLERRRTRYRQRRTRPLTSLCPRLDPR